MSFIFFSLVETITCYIKNSTFFLIKLKLHYIEYSENYLTTIIYIGKAIER